jgi:hypothetical protein
VPIKFFETYQNLSCGRDRQGVCRWEQRAAAGQPGKGEAVKRRIIVAIAAAVLSLGVAAPAYADPAFGPGNNGGGVGNSGPQEGKCHPPGQTTTEPGCK